MKKFSLLFLPFFFIGFTYAQDAEVEQQNEEIQTEEVDPIEKARLAKEAAEKAAAEAEAANEAALEAAAAKAAKEAREKVKKQKEDEEARRAAEKQAAEDAELDAVAKAAAEEAKRKMAEELGLEIDSDESDSLDSTMNDSTQTDGEEPWTVEVKGPLSGFGLRLNVGMPLYSATYLSDNFNVIPSGGITISTPYGFSAGPVPFNVNISVFSTGFEQNLGVKFADFGIFAELSGNMSDLLAFIPTKTEFNTGAGFLPNGGFGFGMGGKLAIPLNLPIGLGLVGNAYISQTDIGATGWIYGGVELGYEF